MIFWIIICNKQDFDFDLFDLDFTTKDYVSILIPIIIWCVFLAVLYMWAFGRLI